MVAQNIPATQIEQVPESPEEATALISPARIAVHHMRLECMLYKLTGDGEMDEQDLEAEWQHKLKNTPGRQRTTDHMDDNQKKRFLQGERHAFVEGVHNAFARAQAKLEAQTRLEAQARLEA